MLSDFLDFLAELKDKFVSSRVMILGIVFAAMFAVLVCKLYSLQILHGGEYQEEYIEMTERSVATPAARGRIYDRNGNLLAYNAISNDVVIQDNGYYATTNDKNLMFYRLVQLLEKSGEEIVGEFKVKINENGKYVFSTGSNSARKGFLRDIYGLKSIDELDDEAGKYPSSISAEEIVLRQEKNYKLDELKDENENLIKLTDREKLDIINIRYTMSLTSYIKYQETTVAKDVSESTKIKLFEEQSNIIGVDVKETTRRQYNDAVYFSSIIGYTGKVQEDQLAALQQNDKTYTLNDTVGRIGIEQTMEQELHGIKGEKSMYVDNVGHIKEIISEIDAQAGNDVYLTIDRDLQIATYHLVERQLAGVLVSKIVNEDNPNENVADATSIMIPIKDVYYQLINNNILDLDKFASPLADSNERHIYEEYETYHEKIMANLRKELTGENPTPLNELDEDMNQYMVYIYNKLSSEDVIVKDAIDQSTDYYLGWKNDTITMKDFLYAGISDNWLDSSMIDVKSKYSDADDIFYALIDYIEETLSSDRDFTKLNYKYMIKKEIITGRELCMALYSQGALEDTFDHQGYDGLSSHGEDYAFSFIIDKISNIELTPAQLALDPCTAGCVVTDVNTGDVLALVSYPGYDNNLLTDNMDVEYYNSLLNDQSLPLYNNATQAKKAPGSTFKPITAVAALEEGAIDEYGTVTCTGIYDAISPPIRCWIYPAEHGELDVVGGIANSCNYFFNEMGHRLATTADGNYDTEKGLNTIAKYATYFGLDHKSGVEITETEPSISTISPEQSAMGQGSHSYTNVQLSRYVSAIANRGTVYELTLLDKETDSNGNLVTQYSPRVTAQLPFDDRTWDLVQEGMHKVTTEGSARNIFNDIEYSFAGKTGTAQETKSRGNHAFFISFAPYDDPTVAVTVNIPYGYSSTNAALVAKNVYNYYFGYTSFDEAVNGGALTTSGVTIGD